MPTTITPNRCRRLASRIVRPASAAPSRNLHLLHVQIEVVRARGQLDEVDHRGPERGLRELQSADLVRRQHAIGPRPDQLGFAVFGLRAAQDEEIGAQQARRQHRVDVLRVGADRGDEPARPRDADSLQHLFAARIGLDREVAGGDRLLHPGGVALDDDEGHSLPGELAGDGLPDAAEAADDEVVRQIVEHAFPAAADPALLQVSLDHLRHQERERVQNGRDAAHHQGDGEDLPGARQGCTSRYPTVVTVVTVM